jgi:omega-6 fatty acid desaturase (delta-12 desaturase)
VAKYQEPSVWRSSWQLVNTLIPYLSLCVAMYYSLDYSYWLTLALALPSGLLLVRIFTISHDCGHGSYFKSARANTFWGSITAFLCVTPYHYWKRDHAVHHAGTGNLDRRGTGDIWTLTVKEYLESSPRRRLAYRLYRNPMVLFVVGTFYLFVVQYRFMPEPGREKERLSVLRTNASLIAALVLAHFTIGIPALLLIQLPVIAVTSIVGSWLFYVQHQYEDVYWARKDEWDFVDACLEGSSFFKLPAVLDWFTGSIGYHHIHHLSSKIPNYNLARCHRENPVFQKVHQITFFSAFRCMKYRLIDEDRGELIGFAGLRKIQQA